MRFRFFYVQMKFRFMQQTHWRLNIEDVLVQLKQTLNNNVLHTIDRSSKCLELCNGGGSALLLRLIHSTMTGLWLVAIVVLFQSGRL